MSAGKGSIVGALRWWVGALAAAIVRGPDPFRHGAVRLRLSAGGFTIVDADGAIVGRLSSQAPSSAALKAVGRARARYLDLDDETVLAVRATLPSAAHQNLREAVALRISELTPFTEDEVIFDLGRAQSIGADAVSVTAYIAPNRLVADRLAVLADLDIPIDGIVASETGEATGAEIPDFAPQFRRRRARRAGQALALASAICIGGVIWLHGVITERQTEERRLLTEAISAALENIRAANALDAEIAELSAALSLPHAHRARRIPPLELLNGVAAALPDTAYLTRLSWAGDDVVMTGLAENASALIATLEASPILSGARFSAPVARDPRIDRDRFSVTARAVRAEPKQ